MKVLIADDEVTTRILLEESVAEWGYEICAVVDGTEARKVLEGDNAPDLAILDWMMPGMTGPELCRRLRQSTNAKYTYIILLTSNRERKDVILGMDSGADAYLTKPVNLEELKSRIAAGQRILERQAQLSMPRVQERTRCEPVPGKPNISPSITQSSLAGITDLTRDLLLAPARRAMYCNRLTPVLGSTLLLKKIGEGGMGAVYRGYDTCFKCEIAVKVLSAAHFCEKSVAATRFYREAQIATSVRSQHLVSVAELGEENGLIYFVMELINGVSAMECLKRTCAAGHRMPEEAALDICIAAAKGLSAAHDGGIIHRDVKPDNILIPFGASDDSLDHSAAKLADLGIARLEVERSGITRTNALLGTAGYMAPEQIFDAKRAGKPADVFGLGATLYVLLGAQMPFTGQSAFDVFNSTINSAHKPLRSLRDDVSQTTAAIVDVCLSKRPEDRFVDAGALLEDLIYCRRLLDTRRPLESDRSSVSLPRVIERTMEQAVPRGLPTRNGWGKPLSA